MLDAIVSWGASATGAPTSYQVRWTYNGSQMAAVNVPRTAALDASGYSLDFATSNPTITVKGGDQISAIVRAVDSVNNLQSDYVATVPATVTIPAPPAPPSVPQNPVLALA